MLTLIPSVIGLLPYNQGEKEHGGRYGKAAAVQPGRREPCAETAEKIRANADRQREILLAEAYRDAERLRGEADGRATAIYASAYNVNPEFYSFYRSISAYKESFNNKEDILVVDPSADFFKYFKNPNR